MSPLKKTRILVETISKKPPVEAGLFFVEYGINSDKFTKFQDALDKYYSISGEAAIWIGKNLLRYKEFKIILEDE